MRHKNKKANTWKIKEKGLKEYLDGGTYLKKNAFLLMTRLAKIHFKQKVGKMKISKANWIHLKLLNPLTFSFTIQFKLWKKKTKRFIMNTHAKKNDGKYIDGLCSILWKRKICIPIRDRK